ncbi:unnamed protein product [Paramecium primaurelia]|uniref:Uncharacterized protein n=1 Tax=Paramecium primaurelia TaxID=5886 RepID=A0A8S1LNT4_PARPR|nr:unnamed protein product [Paramecium primaurelia]
MNLKLIFYKKSNQDNLKDLLHNNNNNNKLLLQLLIYNNNNHVFKLQVMFNRVYTQIQKYIYIQLNNYTTSKIYQSSSQNLPSPTLISQNYQFQPIYNSSTTTKKQVIISNDVEKNLYPKEDNISLQIVYRIGSRDYTNYQAPQIIVSQYKPIN